jgi:hypothetical protein
VRRTRERLAARRDANYRVEANFVWESAMNADAVDVRFDSGHLFLQLSDGQAVEFPLRWFPVLEAATADERTHFAISLDRQQLYWPELDEDVSVPALLLSLPDTRH